MNSNVATPGFEQSGIQDHGNEEYRNVIERRCIEVSALPPNKGMERTVKSVTPFAKKRAKVAPLFPAAHSRR